MANNCRQLGTEESASSCSSEPVDSKKASMKKKEDEEGEKTETMTPKKQRKSKKSAEAMFDELGMIAGFFEDYNPKRKSKQLQMIDLQKLCDKDDEKLDHYDVNIKGPRVFKRNLKSKCSVDRLFEDSTMFMLDDTNEDLCDFIDILPREKTRQTPRSKRARLVDSKTRIKPSTPSSSTSSSSFPMDTPPQTPTCSSTLTADTLSETIVRDCTISSPSTSTIDSSGSQSTFGSSQCKSPLSPSVRSKRPSIILPLNPEKDISTILSDICK